MRFAAASLPIGEDAAIVALQAVGHQLHSDIIEDVLLLALLAEDAVEREGVPPQTDLPLAVGKEVISEVVVLAWANTDYYLNRILRFHFDCWE